MDQERIWHHFQNESPEVFRQGDGRIRFLVREILSRVPKKATVLNVDIGEGLFETLARPAASSSIQLIPTRRRLPASAPMDTREWAVSNHFRSRRINSLPWLFLKCWSICPTTNSRELWPKYIASCRRTV